MNVQEAIKILSVSGELRKQLPNLAPVYDVAVKALKKQIPIPLEEKVNPDFPHIGKMFYCKCGTAYFGKGNKYCAVCGQRLESES